MCFLRLIFRENIRIKFFEIHIDLDLFHCCRNYVFHSIVITYWYINSPLWFEILRFETITTRMKHSGIDIILRSFHSLLFESWIFRPSVSIFRNATVSSPRTYKWSTYHQNYKKLFFLKIFSGGRHKVFHDYSKQGICQTFAFD